MLTYCSVPITTMDSLQEIHFIPRNCNFAEIVLSISLLYGSLLGINVLQCFTSLLDIV